mmetsp:Transcript_16291/g.24463  ORF Transcript_16291/g.24463 Transcript_16291/m.24463 type:complete len:203 (-) Transcript_16291:561-1169(-)
MRLPTTCCTFVPSSLFTALILVVGLLQVQVQVQGFQQRKVQVRIQKIQIAATRRPAIQLASSLHERARVPISIANTDFKSPNNNFALPAAAPAFALASSLSLEAFSILDDADGVDNGHGNDTDTHPILNHHAISVLSTDIRPRSRIKAKHKYLFENNEYQYIVDDVDSRLKLFDELALVACDTGVVCRKELFETLQQPINPC